jgi:pheromone shutdown protein TraB
LSIWWYNRNLRIFRKLQQITEDAKDRILVVIGNGHAEVLRQLIESSPEYDFIEFADLK